MTTKHQKNSRNGISLFIIGVVAVICLVCLAIIARNWSCRAPRPPRPPITKTFEVLSVTTGASITVKDGLRKKRTRIVMLQGIAAPTLGEVFSEESRANLEKMAGSQIRVVYNRDGLLGACDMEEEDDGSMPELGKKSIVGDVYSVSGAWLNIAQLAEGWAACLPGAPDDWKVFEAEAKKLKRGVWQESEK